MLLHKRSRSPRVVTDLRKGQDLVFDAREVLADITTPDRTLRQTLSDAVSILDAALAAIDFYIESIGLGGTGHDEHLADVSNVRRGTHATVQST